MKIVYLHMHLKPGGVTTVISQQAAAITDTCDVLVITGDNPPAGFPAPHVRIDALGYDDPNNPETARPPSETAEAIERAITARWAEGCDVIHVHNPLLAKNSRLIGILEQLRARGSQLFLQVHDFAEDGRPGSYYRNRPYPSDCHYGTINARDSRILETAGLHPDGIHELFNMVNPFDTTGVSEDAPASFLYPVRAIRRKNIGEALLLSLFFPEDTPLAITLPPNSPADWAVYNEWKTFAEKRRLNVIFEASSVHDFRALVARARHLVTTSIAEGFGFVFLEPWMAGKALIGRKIPEICRDFEARGLRFDPLYEHLFVPLEWIDPETFEIRWKQCLREAYARYGATIDETGVQKGFEHVTRNKTIDFAGLGEVFQQRVLDRLLDDPDACSAFEAANPSLKHFRDPPGFDDIVSSNRDNVFRHYNKDAYRERLLDIYHAVKNRRVRHAIDKDVLLRQFLQPENFSVIKWCDDAVS